MCDLTPLASIVGSPPDATKLLELTTPRQIVMRPQAAKALNGALLDVALSVAWLDIVDASWQEPGASSAPQAPKPIILLLHGNSCSSLEFAPLGTYLALRGFRVLLFDLRGTGNSHSGDNVLPDPLAAITTSAGNPANKELPPGVTDGSATAWTWDDCADDVIFILDHFRITQKVHVLGFSSGGVQAQIVGVKYPERVSTLILGNTGLSMIGVNVEASSLFPSFYQGFGPLIVMHPDNDPDYTLERYVEDKMRFVCYVLAANPNGARRESRGCDSQVAALEAVVPGAAQNGTAAEAKGSENPCENVDPSWLPVLCAIYTETFRRNAVDWGIRGAIRTNLARDEFEQRQKTLADADRHVWKLSQLRHRHGISSLVIGGKKDPMMIVEEVERLWNVVTQSTSSCAGDNEDSARCVSEVAWLDTPHWIGDARDETQLPLLVDRIVEFVASKL